MFLRNERGLGVKNGTLGTVEAAQSSCMAVRTDDGRRVAFETRDYAHIDHGYAATIHKAQGVTVDRNHVLVTPGKRKAISRCKGMAQKERRAVNCLLRIGS